jgi:hypothetical protein
MSFINQTVVLHYKYKLHYIHYITYTNEKGVVNGGDYPTGNVRLGNVDNVKKYDYTISRYIEFRIYKM